MEKWWRNRVPPEGTRSWPQQSKTGLATAAVPRPAGSRQNLTWHSRVAPINFARREFDDRQPIYRNVRPSAACRRAAVPLKDQRAKALPTRRSPTPDLGTGQLWGGVTRRVARTSLVANVVRTIQSRPGNGSGSRFRRACLVGGVEVSSQNCSTNRRLPNGSARGSTPLEPHP